MKKEERRERGLYWDQAWKLVEGCTKVSPGCDNCWSEQETAMRCGHPNAAIRERARAVVHLAQIPGDKTMFDGRILLREDNLELPLRTKKPTVFAIWNDLFHEDVPDEFRDRAYAVMALRPQHTFLVLTKRAERMAEYLRGAELEIRDEIKYNAMAESVQWPLPNVWHGVTAENQQTADERIPSLFLVPGKRFLSLEPLLGPIGMHWYGWKVSAHHRFGVETPRDSEIHAVLLGGESGKNARPLDREWVRSVRDQCAEADIPFTFKQWGEYAPNWLNDDDGKEILGSVWSDRMGKKKAGRTLDGIIHNNLPWDKDHE